MAATGEISETWDRVVGSDPGLLRLRSALSAAIAISTTLGLEYIYGRATDRGPQGTIIVMLVGALMALFGSMALGDASGARQKIRTGAFFPVALGAGLTVGVCLAGHTDTMLVVFLVDGPPCTRARPGAPDLPPPRWQAPSPSPSTSCPLARTPIRW